MTCQVPSHESLDDGSFDPSRFHCIQGSLTTCSHILVWVRVSGEQLQSVRDMDYSTIAFLPHHRVWHIATLLRLSRLRFVTGWCPVKYIQHNVSLWMHSEGTSVSCAHIIADDFHIKAVHHFNLKQEPIWTPLSVLEGQSGFILDLSHYRWIPIHLYWILQSWFHPCWKVHWSAFFEKLP